MKVLFGIGRALSGWHWHCQCSNQQRSTAPFEKVLFGTTAYPYRLRMKPLNLLRILALVVVGATVGAPRALSCEEHFSSPATQSAIAAADNIFFLRMTNETTLSTIERCALASAVLKNPSKRVNLFSNSISCDLLQTTAHADIHLIRFNVSSVYDGTPFEEWFHRRDWDVAFRGVHLTDSFRLVLLYRFGGVYMDTDVISYRSLDGIGVTIGLEDPWVINNAVMSFPRGHAFVYQLMHDFVLRFRSDFWGWNGPRLITRVWMQHFVDAGGDAVTLAPVEEYYLISWRDGEDKWKRLFSPASALEVSDLLRRTRVIHFWHSLLSPLFSSFQSGAPFFETVAGQIMYASCPNLQEFADRHEPSASSYGLEMAAADSLWLGVYPSIEIMGGRVHPPHSLDGSWNENQCGFLGASVNVVEIAIPTRTENWTLSFWVNTFILDATSRMWPQDTPPTQPLCIPHCNFGIPAVALTENSLASRIAAEHAHGDVFVLSLEQGHLAIGNSKAEWSRTVSSIADGRWHHVSIVVSPAATPGSFFLHLVLDGLLHIEHIELTQTATVFSHIVFGSPSIHGGGLFVDELGLIEHSVSLSDIVRIRNLQLLASAKIHCSPTMPWFGAAVSSPPDARVMTMIISDARESSVAQRMTVRSTWLALASNPRRHIFCVGDGGDDALLDLEAVQYGDLVHVPVNDVYQHLSGKVFACLSRTQTLFGGTFDFLVKTDHDVFLRIDVLELELGAILAQHRAAADGAAQLLHWRGFAYNDIPPMRDLSDKNADSQNPLAVFPPYTAGVGYILSAAIVAELTALRNPVMSLNEDQTLGLWMEQRVASGSRRVSPIHDIRFQQWATCFSAQVAIHFSTPSKLMGLVAHNLRAGRNLCDGVGASPCCLCCDCEASCQSWFTCDEKGARLNSFVSLGSLIPPLAPLSDLLTSTELLSRIKTFKPSSFDCPFEFGKWHAVGQMQLMLAPLDGVELTCPRDVLLSRTQTPSFCAASISFRQLTLGCTPSDTESELDSAALVSEGAQSLGYRSTPRTTPPQFSSCEPVAPSKKPRSKQLLLFSAMVDTAGACTLHDLEPNMRESRIAPAYFERNYYGPPFYGSFAAYCGAFVDVHHADGSVSILRSAFARNASRHLHYQVLRVFNEADIVDAVVTIVQPSSPSSSSIIRVSDISLLQLSGVAEEMSGYQGALRTASQVYGMDPRQRSSFFRGSLPFVLSPRPLLFGWFPVYVTVASALFIVAYYVRTHRNKRRGAMRPHGS